MTLHEVAEAARIIQEAVDEDANIISGMVIDEGLEEAMKVTVIATGFDRAPGALRPVPKLAAVAPPEPRDDTFPSAIRSRRGRRRPSPSGARSPSPSGARRRPRPRPRRSTSPSTAR